MLYKHNIAGGVWLMTHESVQDYLPVVANYIKGRSPQKLPVTASDPHELNTKNSVLTLSPTAGVYPISEYGDRVRPENAPEGSIAIIEITDAITKYDQDCGPAGMVTKSNLLKRCYKTRNIDAIVLKIDSGGGEGYAMFHMCEAIAERNKPVYAFVSDMAASAAYGIASACDSICVNMDLAKVGSIGAYITLLDYRKYFEKQGINVLEIYADQSKKKNIEFREALKGNAKPLTEMLNVFTDKFINMVKTNRKSALKSEDSVWNNGAIFYASEALKVGLIDSIDTWDKFLSDIETNIQNNNSSPMNKQPLNLNAVLGVESLESTNDGVYLNLQQIEAVDVELGARTSKINQLTQDKQEVEEGKTKAENDLNLLKTEMDTVKQNHQTALSEKDQEIEDLKSQVATLQGGASGSVRKIVTKVDNEEGGEKTGMSGFMSAVANAREMYRSLPQ